MTLWRHPIIPPTNCPFFLHMQYKKKLNTSFPVLFRCVLLFLSPLLPPTRVRIKSVFGSLNYLEWSTDMCSYIIFSQAFTKGFPHQLAQCYCCVHTFLLCLELFQHISPAWSRKHSLVFNLSIPAITQTTSTRCLLLYILLPIAVFSIFTSTIFPPII